MDELAGLLIGDAHRLSEARAEFGTVTRRMAEAESVTCIPGGDRN